MIRKAKPLPPPVELGPEHDGLEMSVYEFDAAGGRDGFRYELIDGVLNVVPAPDHSYQDIADAIRDLLVAARRPGGRPTFARVKLEPRVMVKDAPGATTNPQPDVAAYTKYPPKPVPPRTRVDPCLVVEVVTPDSRQKDYVRNARLYAMVPSILEYWVVDSVKDPRRPTMTVMHRKTADESFEKKVIRAGGQYTSRRWPGIKVDLSRIAVD